MNATVVIKVKLLHFSIEINIFAQKKSNSKPFNASLYHFDTGAWLFAWTIPPQFGLEECPNFFLPSLISMTIVHWSPGGFWLLGGLIYKYCKADNNLEVMKLLLIIQIYRDLLSYSIPSVELSQISRN